jgi:hypothetical protein
LPASAATTASAGTTPSIGSSQSSSAKPAKGLSATDASTLDAELSAIQSELDRLSTPSDSDFSGIESGLK